ncbi:bzip transcription factor [Grosmannia clavigera kw1407]|uniref:Bzip transcription factor n=1 Tax=Grosmannia clavigera (strain kw1407 / UAMH 11150) TaxID=655863 RepID=F0XQP9_GROCL|nr:bzip transcription factor [Grosmannia clavigera kw1407]EFW99777.1 bzip transcription factor [Grosmannia clavigera kw1407]
MDEERTRKSEEQPQPRIQGQEAETPSHHERTADLADSSHSDDRQDAIMQSPIPTRPKLPSRKSSGTIIISRDSEEALHPVDSRTDYEDVTAMSPRRTSQDLEEMGRQTRDEVRKHAKMLQDSLLLIFHRIQAVKEEHDKLDSNNKFLQKYIGDLMSTSKITASGSSRAKK